MDIILSLVTAGGCGTAAFLVVVKLFHLAGISQADPLFALTSLVTRKTKKNTALALGLLVFGGIALAFGHYVLLSMFAKQPVASLAMMGALLGFGNGLVVTLASLYLIVPRHPVAEFQELPFPALIMYVTAHIGYGVAVAMVFSSMGVCLPFLPHCPA